MKMLTSPGENLAPLKSQAIQGVNQSYNGLTDRIMEQMNARGFGRSGMAGKAILGSQLGRAGSIASLEPKFASMALGQQMSAAQLMEALLGLNRGQHATSSGTQTSETVSTPSLMSSIAGIAGAVMGIPGIGGMLGGGAGPAQLPISTMAPSQPLSWSALPPGYGGY